jgi:hypothetical protein
MSCIIDYGFVIREPCLPTPHAVATQRPTVFVRDGKSSAPSEQRALRIIHARAPCEGHLIS